MTDLEVISWIMDLLKFINQDNPGKNYPGLVKMK